MAGLTISDRILGRDLSLKMRNRFERCLEEEFTECDGRILPLRSEFTGLTVGTPQIDSVDNRQNTVADLPRVLHEDT